MQLGVTTIINFPRSRAKSYLRMLKDSGKLLVGVSFPPKGRVMMMTMIIMMMIIERINCVKTDGHELPLYLEMDALGRNSPLRHLLMHERDVPPDRHQYIECGIFPDTDQLCLSEGIRPSLGTKVGRLTALRGERRGLLSNWRIRQSELISAVSCQRLALKGDF